MSSKNEHINTNQYIAVQVVYAEPDYQVIRKIQVTKDCTIAESIMQSNIASYFPNINFDELEYGIYGQIKPANTPLKNGDRVEIYRPIKANPMEQRKERANKKHSNK